MPYSSEAIYANGVLTPLEPLALAENQRVHVSITELADNRMDDAFRACCAKYAAEAPSLETVRGLLAGASSPFSETIRRERDE
jgi:predicted DNA-binding antitoxin AbrB/MazE fold protein